MATNYSSYSNQFSYAQYQEKNGFNRLKPNQRPRAYPNSPVPQMSPGFHQPMHMPRSQSLGDVRYFQDQRNSPLQPQSQSQPTVAADPPARYRYRNTRVFSSPTTPQVSKSDSFETIGSNSYHKRTHSNISLASAPNANQVPKLIPSSARLKRQQNYPRTQSSSSNEISTDSDSLRTESSWSSSTSTQSSAYTMDDDPKKKIKDINDGKSYYYANTKAKEARPDKPKLVLPSDRKSAQPVLLEQQPQSVPSVLPIKPKETPKTINNKNDLAPALNIPSSNDPKTQPKAVSAPAIFEPTIEPVRAQKQAQQPTEVAPSIKAIIQQVETPLQVPSMASHLDSETMSIKSTDTDNSFCINEPELADIRPIAAVDKLNDAFEQLDRSIEIRLPNLDNNSSFGITSSEEVPPLFNESSPSDYRPRLQSSFSDSEIYTNDSLTAEIDEIVTSNIIKQEPVAPIRPVSQCQPVDNINSSEFISKAQIEQPPPRPLTPRAPAASMAPVTAPPSFTPPTATEKPVAISTNRASPPYKQVTSAPPVVSAPYTPKFRRTTEPSENDFSRSVSASTVSTPQSTPQAPKSKSLGKKIRNVLSKNKKSNKPKDSDMETASVASVRSNMSISSLSSMFSFKKLSRTRSRDSSISFKFFSSSSSLESTPDPTPRPSSTSSIRPPPVQPPTQPVQTQPVVRQASPHHSSPSKRTHQQAVEPRPLTPPQQIRSGSPPTDEQTPTPPIESLRITQSDLKESNNTDDYVFEPAQKLVAGDIFPGSLKSEDVDVIVDSVEQTGDFERRPSVKRRINPQSTEEPVSKVAKLTNTSGLQSALKFSRTHQSQPKLPRSAYKPSAQVKFAESVTVYVTYGSDTYDRIPNKVTCDILREPGVVQRIRDELNSLKLEMPIHPMSRQFTQYFS